MANIFDQFDTVDAPRQNVFDQFDESQSKLDAADIAKSGGVGIAKGVIGIAGLPGDVSELGARGIDRATGYVSDKLGVPYTPRPDQPFRYGSSDIQNAVQSVTGEFYKPKTTVGEYAQTVGEFLPAAAAGPGGIARKVALNAAVPGVASEGAGQLTQGTAAEPWARLGGALLAPAGIAAVERTAANTALPTAEAIKDAARAQYRAPEVAAVQIHPASVSNMASRIESGLVADGFRPANTPEAFSILNEMRPPQGVSSVAVADLDSMRKAAGVTAKQVDAIGRPTADAVAAQRVQRGIDDYLANLQQPELLAGDAQQASAILNDARANWAAASKSEDVGARLTRAERQAAKSGTGSNIDNAIRQKISALLDVPSRTVGFQPQEVAQMEQIVRGTPTRNALRTVGKLGVDGRLSLLLHSGAALGSGGATIPVAIAGTAARKIAEALTQRSVNNLDNMIRSRAPASASAVSANQQTAARIRQEALARALISASGSSAR